MDPLHVTLGFSLGMNVILLVSCWMLKVQKNGWKDIYFRLKWDWEEDRARRRTWTPSVSTSEASTPTTSSQD